METSLIVSDIFLYYLFPFGMISLRIGCFLLFLKGVIPFWENLVLSFKFLLIT